MTLIEVSYTLRIPGRVLEAATDQAIHFIRQQLSMRGDIEQPEVISFRLTATEELNQEKISELSAH